MNDIKSQSASSSTKRNVVNRQNNNNNFTNHRRSNSGNIYNNNNNNNSSNNSLLQFNPRLILSQIIALQSFHYLILCIIIQMNHVVFATSITIDRIFTTKYLYIWSSEGWIDNSAVLLSSITGYVLFHFCLFYYLDGILHRCIVLIFKMFTYPLFCIYIVSQRSLLLAIIVEKSKKCLDFSVTLFFIHIIICTIYDGIPSKFLFIQYFIFFYLLKQNSIN